MAIEKVGNKYLVTLEFDYHESSHCPICKMCLLMVKSGERIEQDKSVIVECPGCGVAVKVYDAIRPCEIINACS